jgi:hypothetical protein
MADGGDDKEASGFRKLIADVQKVALPLLVSGGRLLAFVAFVGGALTWARFANANLPADQAVSAMPETERSPQEPCPSRCLRCSACWPSSSLT